MTARRAEAPGRAPVPRQNAHWSDGQATGPQTGITVRRHHANEAITAPYLEFHQVKSTQAAFPAPACLPLLNTRGGRLRRPRIKFSPRPQAKRKFREI